MVVRGQTIGINVQMATYTLLGIVDKQCRNQGATSVELLLVEHIINFCNPIEVPEKESRGCCDHIFILCSGLPGWQKSNIIVSLVLLATCWGKKKYILDCCVTIIESKQKYI